MPTTDTPPATLTAADYRAALALIDATPIEVYGCGVTADLAVAVVRLVRQDLHEQIARAMSADALINARDDFDVRYARMAHETATAQRNAAVAALVALAVGGAS